MIDTKRNVVLVSTDSLRADHCGFMGYDHGTTPTLDTIAEEGLCFENAYAPGPSTLDSMPAIFTGEFPIDRSTDANEQSIQQQLREHMLTRETIAEQFSQMGYHTAGFSTNPWTSRHLEFDKGFDQFEDFMEETRSKNRVAERLSDGALSSTPLTHLYSWKNEQNMFQTWLAFYDDILETVADLEEPYFLWIFLVDTHMPYLTKEQYRSQSKVLSYLSNLFMYSKSDLLEPLVRDRLIQAYDDSIEQMDAFVDRIMDDLSKDDPLFVFHSDHGEGFGDNDFYGHGANIYEDQVHVPLLVANGPEGTVEEPFSLRSLPELTTALARGQSYDDLIGTPIVYKNTEKTAVHGNDWKYIHNSEKEENEFYCWENDCWQSVSDEQMKAVAQQLLDDWQHGEKEKRHIATSTQRIAKSEPL